MSLQDTFTGKKVLVVGGGRGIGLAVVRRLYSYGAKVYALGKNPENLRKIKEECPKIVTVQCDMTNWEETRKAVGSLEVMDYLLNNAGTGMVKTLMTSSPQDYEEIFQVNVKGAWNISQVVAEKMISAKKRGSICFISSIAGGKPFPLFGLYSMSKAALEMMSNLLAVELGPHNIRVNTIRPGSVDTDLLNIAETGVGSVMGAEDAFKDFMVGRTPYPGYHMEMEDLVNLILFTLSDLTKQMTGTVLTMDGGFQLT